MDDSEMNRAWTGRHVLVGDAMEIVRAVVKTYIIDKGVIKRVFHEAAIKDFHGVGMSVAGNDAQYVNFIEKNKPRSPEYGPGGRGVLLLAWERWRARLRVFLAC